jgi:glycosyltransferase involved in cell wall biosynthesis
MEVFAKLPEQKLKIFPMGNLPENISKLKNVEIINGVNWTNGLGDAIMKSKAVLMPSLWSSTIEYALWEALQIKKAVVVFKVGAHKDIFKNGYNALVVEPNDIESYAKAVLALDENEELRKLLEENGNKTLLEINNPDKLYLQLIEAYSLKNN